MRHLVMPRGIAGTDQVLSFLGDEISKHTYLNLMDQYQPCYREDEFPEPDWPITGKEYREALAIAARHGLSRLDQRRPYVPSRHEAI